MDVEDVKDFVYALDESQLSALWRWVTLRYMSVAARVFPFCKACETRCHLDGLPCVPVIGKPER